VTVEERIAQEMAAERATVASVEEQLPDAQAEYDLAWDAETAAGDSPPFPVVSRADAAAARLHSLLDRRKTALARIARLESPEEHARRAATAERIATMRARLAERERADTVAGGDDAPVPSVSGSPPEPNRAPPREEAAMAAATFKVRKSGDTWGVFDPEGTLVATAKTRAAARKLLEEQAENGKGEGAKALAKAEAPRAAAKPEPKAEAEGDSDGDGDGGEESPGYQRIRELRAPGPDRLSYTATCRKLNEEGIPPARGSKWHPPVVRNIAIRLGLGD
jgi:hypothetical protein